MSYIITNPYRLIKVSKWVVKMAIRPSSIMTILASIMTTIRHNNY